MQLGALLGREPLRKVEVVVAEAAVDGVRVVRDGGLEFLKK